MAHSEDSTAHSESQPHVRTVAIIGAGVSGVAAAIHLERAGLEVTVYERSKACGGVWVYDESTAKDASYPSTLPSVGDSPEFPDHYDQAQRQDSPFTDCESGQSRSKTQFAQIFAPPGPCYVALKNNVSTIEMEMTCQTWLPGTDEFVPHRVLAEYIQSAARANHITDLIQFDTRVTSVQKTGTQWEVETATLHDCSSLDGARRAVSVFDAVVVATGHYHACKVPDLPGLAEWKAMCPTRVRHSKLYRRADEFKDQNVLLIGAGVSSLDIAKDLADVACAVYQSSRGGMYDLPSALLPNNAARIGAIERFVVDETPTTMHGTIPGKVVLDSGQTLCNIHQVVVCTGYHVSFPFMRQYHADGMQPEDADEDVLVTDGTVTHNLHHDIFYIQDPTLSFIGVPYHTATFSLFEFQAMALAAVFSGRTALPPKAQMRAEYQERVKRKGAGRTLHSLKGDGMEILYVQDLMRMVGGGSLGHSKAFLQSYERRRQRQAAMASLTRDSNEHILARLPDC